MSDACEPCVIIILDYAQIPGQCDTLKHRSLAIEEMYDKVKPSPTLHAQVVKEQEAIIRVLGDANASQLALLKRLSGEPRRE